jgi:radical SAM protein with 4Fe4S-binding SPASM domain
MEYDIDNYIQRKAKFDVHAYLGNIIGKRYTAYRNAWACANADNIPSFPIHLDLQLADRCNKKCHFCPRDLDSHPGFKGLIGTGAVLEQHLIQRLVDECSEKNLYSINFGAGNEPLLCDNLLDVLGAFHKGGVVDSWVITNGVLLDRWVDRILESPLVNLYVSIDAYTAETYAKLRGTGFNAVRQAVLSLMNTRARRNLALPLVRVSFIKHPTNLHELEPFVSFWKDIVDFIDIQTFYDYRVLGNDTARSKQRDCLDPYKRLAVQATGAVVPCASDFGLGLQVGNIKNQRLKEIWDGAALAEVRENVRLERNSKCTLCQTM